MRLLPYRQCQEGRGLDPVLSLVGQLTPQTQRTSAACAFPPLGVAHAAPLAALDPEWSPGPIVCWPSPSGVYSERSAENGVRHGREDENTADSVFAPLGAAERGCCERRSRLAERRLERTG